MSDSSDTRRRSIGRRGLLKSVCGLSIGLGTELMAQVDTSGSNLAPQQNDWIVFAFGDRQGMRVEPDDLAVGDQQVFVYPQDPASGITRNASRLNQSILVRVDTARLSERTRLRAVDGIVAYSGVCSHTGCDVTDWNSEQMRFQCPCHESQFDPSDNARVVGGPAPWPLAALPLKLVDGKLAVAGSWEGRVGFQQPGLDPFGVGI